LLQKIAAGFMGLISSKEWLLASKATVMKVLTLDGLLVPHESSLFIALVKWGEHQVKSRGDEVTAAATRTELIDLLPLIRFRNLTADQFSKLCEQDCSSVLSENEKSAISKCLETDDELDMPPNFSIDIGSRDSCFYICRSQDSRLWQPPMPDAVDAVSDESATPTFESHFSNLLDHGLEFYGSDKEPQDLTYIN
jgi:hypothetical protein